MTHFLLPIFTIFALWQAFFSTQLIAQSPKNPYENIECFEVFQTLEKPCSQFVQNATLRTVLENISTAYDISVWIDRRVDKEHSVSISTDDQATVGSVLEKIAADCDCKIAFINQIAYFAPSEEASRIEFAYWQLYSLTSSNAGRRQVDAWEWTRVTQPVELINERAHKLSLKLTTDTSIEHDLWRSHRIPASNLAAQWTCALSGFGSTLRVDPDNAIQIEPAKAPENVRFTYSATQMQGVGKSPFQAWKETWPEAFVKKTATNSWLVTASVAAHRQFIQLANASEIANIAAARSRIAITPKLDNSRFSLKANGSLGAILNALKQQAPIDIQPWPLATKIEDRRVELDLKQATLDELLQIIAMQTNTKITRQGKIVTIAETYRK